MGSAAGPAVGWCAGDGAGAAAESGTFRSTEDSARACRVGTAARATSQKVPTYLSATSWIKARVSGDNGGYLVDHALYWLWRVDICLMKAVDDIRVAQPPRETNADSSAGNCCLAPFVGNEIVEISIEMHNAQVDAQAGDRT